MNFFTLGYAFLAVQLNFGWVLNYILKLVGMLFMLGGISEISDFSKNFAVMKSGRIFRWEYVLRPPDGGGIQAFRNRRSGFQRGKRYCGGCIGCGGVCIYRELDKASYE